jgi:hypothetical protein
MGKVSILNHLSTMNSYPVAKQMISPVGTPLTLGAMVVCLMTLATPFIATAQSARNFGTQNATAEVTAAKADIKDQPAEIEAGASPVSTTPSRYVGTADTESYVKTVASAFSIRQRPTDVFGQLQDPDAKPIVKAPAPGTLKRIAPVQATPLSEIVRLLVVTTIMPSEKKFLLGTRSVAQGDLLPLRFRGKELKVQVTEVNSRQISFKNLESGETAVRKLDMLPVGMTAGLRGITPPGMSQQRANVPIVLDMAEPITP